MSQQYTKNIEVFTHTCINTHTLREQKIWVSIKREKKKIWQLYKHEHGADMLHGDNYRAVELTKTESSKK